MSTQHTQAAPTPAALSAESRWETKWIAAESVIDPTYERTTEALRRWVDGMEQALISGAARNSRYTSARR
jgi:hypothetical protein